MDSLLFRFAKGDTTLSENEVVQAWRQASSENEAQLQELVRLLELTADEAVESASRPRPTAAELIGVADTVDAPMDDAVLGPGRVRRPGSWRLWLAGAVGAGVSAAALVLAFRAGAPASGDTLGFGAHEFVTGATEAATIHLRDGTVVRLAPQSRLELTGSPGVREVTLTGRAYFAVAKDPERPFTVRSRGGEAVVLGTRFEADARGEELRLLVVEGSVALGSAGNQVRLKAGEMARSVEGAVSAPVKVEDMPPLLEWLGDFLVFQDTPIRRVAAELEAHFGVTVDVVGDELDDQTVTAWFGDASADDVLRVVCKVVAAECSVDGMHARIDLSRARPGSASTAP